jgi:hypothetical protein
MEPEVPIIQSLVSILNQIHIDFTLIIYFFDIYINTECPRKNSRVLVIHDIDINTSY